MIKHINKDILLILDKVLPSVREVEMLNIGKVFREEN